MWTQLPSGNLTADVGYGARALIILDAGYPPFAWAVSRGGRIYAEGANMTLDGAKVSVGCYMFCMRRVIADISGG